MLLDQPKIERTQDGIPQVGSRILGDLGEIPQEGSKTLGDLEDSPEKGQAMPAEETVERSEDDKEEDLRDQLPEWTPNCKNGVYYQKFHFPLFILMHPMEALRHLTMMRWRSSRSTFNPGT